jgi:hypothetical protein
METSKNPLSLMFQFVSKVPDVPNIFRVEILRTNEISGTRGNTDCACKYKVSGFFLKDRADAINQKISGETSPAVFFD